MDNDKRLELTSLLEILPPVEFCCIYGSSLHPNNLDKTSMIDYILGVADPRQWHAENLKMNPSHYASWMVRLGGARLITDVADDIGVGVHFNPFITHNDRRFKYGVVRMHDLVQDVLGWERFYLSGRLQKPVNIILDYLRIAELNSVNLKAATSAALLLLPSKFSEEELYAKICGLSYMGDIRMLFAEDKNKDCELSTVYSLVSSLPWQLRGLMGSKLGEKKIIDGAGRTVQTVVINSKKEVAECVHKILRRKVAVSSARQVVAGLLTGGVVHGVRYLGSKMLKACKSWM
ncbi:uncharacterized protein [Primulina huaijiensis]|uniref:uncharacterized protein isoform X2 n=1 Tax=Primulina huaijiensis TaxID=1492673 RepID=UPI003CC70671